MNTQQQIEYKDQINNYIKFEGLLKCYQLKNKATVNYALLIYKKKFFTLDDLRVTDISLHEARELMPDQEACKEIDRLNAKYPHKGFFTAAILSFFSNQKGE